MAKIFELLGYPLTDRGDEVEQSRRNALCPFMGQICDGGGNRPQSNIDLKNRPDLAQYFSASGLTTISAGVCSLQLGESQTPWIICPRRLLFLAKNGAIEPTQVSAQASEIKALLQYCGFPSNTRIGVWPEVKLKHNDIGDNTHKTFDYTFDYILMPIDNISQIEIEQQTQLLWHDLYPILKSAGYTMVLQRDGYYVENFPQGTPVIIEIMTSSTSGGNKRRRTTIPLAFEDAILNNSHTGPGINYRQVWARMVSQLIAKSEVGLAWGGKTIWVLQDKLVDYISKSTALDMHKFVSENTSDVNMLSLAYDTSFNTQKGILSLVKMHLYAGLIKPPSLHDEPSFQDMLRTAFVPPVEMLIRLLSARLPANILHT